MFGFKRLPDPKLVYFPLIGIGNDFWFTHIEEAVLKNSIGHTVRTNYGFELNESFMNYSGSIEVFLNMIVDSNIEGVYLVRFKAADVEACLRTGSYVQPLTILKQNEYATDTEYALNVLRNVYWGLPLIETQRYPRMPGYIDPPSGDDEMLDP